ncbi:hypothetical protein HMPREF1145_0431 [Oribacterium parvum ACB8]|nr:hypothetical protein HMPREF1145_0431 [Oribacterium parvum ACB8]
MFQWILAGIRDYNWKMSALILGIIDFFYLHLKKTCFY